MSSPNAVSEPSPPPAVAAFLRGMERRAAVLAELQAGDAAAGDAALAGAMGQWLAASAGMTMGEWPVRFWSLLLAQPQLRVRTPVALALNATDRLGELDNGPRAALLLRLVAGLDERSAAEALGVAEQAYRVALQDAFPLDRDGNPDSRAWRALLDQVQRRIKALPPDRLLRLSSAREAVLGGLVPLGRPDPSPAGGARARGWLMTTLWALLVLCALALAATFLPSASDWLAPGDIDSDSAALRDMPAASHYGPEAGLIAHRDFDLLADPDAAQSRDLAFHSWLAAQPAGPMDAMAPAPDVAEPAGGAIPSESPAAGRSETADAPS